MPLLLNIAHSNALTRPLLRVGFLDPGKSRITEAQLLFQRDSLPMKRIKDNTIDIVDPLGDTIPVSTLFCSSWEVTTTFSTSISLRVLTTITELSLRNKWLLRQSYWAILHRKRGLPDSAARKQSDS